MSKSTSNAAILSLSLDRSAKRSLQAQLLSALRALMHRRALQPGDKLPSSRALARELSVSRMTVTAVFDQLVAEGYLEGRRGSGVFVAKDLENLPDEPARPRQARSARVGATEPLQPFALGAPDMQAFPYRDWVRHYDRVWRAPERRLLGRTDPAGWGPLRAAIAEHLNAWRGIACDADQIIVTSGLVETVAIMTRALFASGDRILLEEPGHSVLRNALRSNGLEIDPIRVDRQGFDIREAGETANTAKGVVVTPSRQFPLGMTLPVARRLDLLGWANNQNGYIVEDDFDGEFRYTGQPLPAMMSLDRDGRVIYVGSFSKVLFSSARMAYIAIPDNLIDEFYAALNDFGSQASFSLQPVLANFMNSGDFATHIRRMRRLYAQRQRALRSAIAAHLTTWLRAAPEAGGMHLLAELSPEASRSASDAEIARRAAELGVTARPLSDFFHAEPDAQGLVLGYAGFQDAELARAARRLAAAFE